MIWYFHQYFVHFKTLYKNIGYWFEFHSKFIINKRKYNNSVINNSNEFSYLKIIFNLTSTNSKWLLENTSCRVFSVSTHKSEYAYNYMVGNYSNMKMYFCTNSGSKALNRHKLRIRRMFFPPHFRFNDAISTVRTVSTVNSYQRYQHYNCVHITSQTVRQNTATSYLTSSIWTLPRRPQHLMKFEIKLGLCQINTTEEHQWK